MIDRSDHSKLNNSFNSYENIQISIKISLDIHWESPGENIFEKPSF